MALGVTETLSRVYCLGREMYPKLTLNGLKHQVLLFGLALVSIADIRKWYEISDNPLLTRALKQSPLMHGAIYWPYINCRWPLRRRLAAIDQHFRMLKGPAEIIAHATFTEVELVRLDEEYDGLRLVLDKAAWFLREGEIVLNLFINDQRIYSVAFSLGLDADQPILVVGALQGSNSERALDVYRDMTHALHGMRPRDFLMAALKLLCVEFEIERIWAISSATHQFNSAYFGHTQKVLVCYDEKWQEHRGRDLGNGFFEMSAKVKRKEVCEIPTRKHATYRRRYKMLDKLALDIKMACQQQATPLDK